MRGTRLTSPLLECGDLPESLSGRALPALKKDIQSLIDARAKSGEISVASVYFRDLNNGPWFGINESSKFFPASLLKLPLAMSFYWKAENDPSILKRSIEYKPSPGTQSEVQPYSPKRNVQEGKKYTIEELIEIMLDESSNEAAVALADVAGKDQITSVYQDLGLPAPAFGADYSITTHDYASFFRILYNASYLDRVNSEKILDILTRSSFKDGLVAGDPSSLTIAHKFGSRQVDSSGATIQLHDCGIVYAPGKPYVLCVMTQGHDFAKLAAFIKDTSALVYSSVSH